MEPLLQTKEARAAGSRDFFKFSLVCNIFFSNYLRMVLRKVEDLYNCDVLSSCLISSSQSFGRLWLVTGAGTDVLIVMYPGILVESPTSAMFVTLDYIIVYELRCSLSVSIVCLPILWSLCCSS